MIRRVTVLIVVCTAAALAVVGPVGAHVTVNPNSATKGGYAKLSFRVPTESADASTTQLEVQFPEPGVAPFRAARVQPHAGWSYEVRMTHLDTPVQLGGDAVSDVVSAVTWTADTPEDAIKPGEFDEFNISLGPLPSDVDTLIFKALQTYANGEVVRWIEAARTDTDDAEPERPAPVLMLTAPTEPDATPTQQETPAVTKSDLDGARTLGTLGIVVGALGLLTGIAAVVVARRPRS